MTTTVLAYFPSPPRGVWHLWIVPIRAYAIFIVIGIVAALVIGDRRWRARGGEPGVIYDIALWAVPFGLIGGRLYHLATDWRTYFGEGGAGLVAALSIWDGGLGIWGAVALGGVGAWIACRRRGIPLPAFGDAIAPGIVLAQAIGRLGNYFNQELFGRETTMPWGLEIFYRHDPPGPDRWDSLNGVSTGQLAMVVQPTFLYELLWNLLIFALLIYLDRRYTIGHGRLFALYVAGYCLGRFCIELLRADDATHIAGIRINSFTSTFVFIGAVVYLILAPKGREDPATLSGSAADLFVPDSVDEAATVGKPDDVAAAPETAVADTKVAEKPDAEKEAVAAEADAAEVDAPVVEVAETPEPAVEPDGQAEAEQAEDEQAEEPAVAVEPEGEAEGEQADDEPAERPAVEPDGQAEAEQAEDEHAEEPAVAVEPDGEAEAEQGDDEPAEEPAVELAGKAEAEQADDKPAEEPAVETGGEAEPDQAAAAEPRWETPELSSPLLGWRLRLASRLRRR